MIFEWEVVRQQIKSCSQLTPEVAIHLGDPPKLNFISIDLSKKLLLRSPKSNVIGLRHGGT